jgi:hypothetical protein
VLIDQKIEVLLISVDVDVSIPSFDDELDLQVDKEVNDFLKTFGQHRKTSLVDNEETVNREFKCPLLNAWSISIKILYDLVIRTIRKNAEIPAPLYRKGSSRTDQ